MIGKIFRVIKNHLRDRIRRYKKSAKGKVRIYNYKTKFFRPKFDDSFKKNKPQLDDIQRKVLDMLNKDGIAVLSFKELFSHAEYEELKQYYKKLHSEARFQEALHSGGNNYKDYIIMASKFDKTVNQGDILFRIGVSPRLLDIVNSYLETWSKALNFDIWHTLASSDTDRKFSQNWHRDPEDEKLIKVFLYLNDVDSDAGPFSYIKGSHGKGKYAHLWPKAHPALGIYPSDTEIYSSVSEDDIIENTGLEGTLILCDTHGIHRGGFGKKERILSYWVYAPHSTASERRNHFIVSDKSVLSDAQKALLT